jgi:hypothetical protein
VLKEVLCTVATVLQRAMCGSSNTGTGHSMMELFIEGAVNDIVRRLMQGLRK